MGISTINELLHANIENTPADELAQIFSSLGVLSENANNDDSDLAAAEFVKSHMENLLGPKWLPLLRDMEAILEKEDLSLDELQGTDGELYLELILGDLAGQGHADFATKSLLQSDVFRDLYNLYESLSLALNKEAMAKNSWLGNMERTTRMVGDVISDELKVVRPQKEVLSGKPQRLTKVERECLLSMPEDFDDIGEGEVSNLIALIENDPRYNNPETISLFLQRLSKSRKSSQNIEITIRLLERFLSVEMIKKASYGSCLKVMTSILYNFPSWHPKWDLLKFALIDKFFDMPDSEVGPVLEAIYFFDFNTKDEAKVKAFVKKHQQQYINIQRPKLQEAGRNNSFVNNIVGRIKNYLPDWQIQEEAYRKGMFFDLQVKTPEGKIFLIELDGIKYHCYEDGTLDRRTEKKMKMEKKQGLPVMHVLNPGEDALASITEWIKRYAMKNDELLLT